MKLLEMNAESLCNELLELSGPISEIAEDKALSDLLQAYRQEDREKTPAVLLLARMWGRLLPILLKDHREAFLRILASVNGKPIDEVLKMPMPELAVNIAKAWRQEIRPFFTLFTASVHPKS